MDFDFEVEVEQTHLVDYADEDAANVPTEENTGEYTANVEGQDSQDIPSFLKLLTKSQPLNRDSDDDLYLSLLLLFFDAKMPQVNLTKIISMISFFMNKEIPKTVDLLVKHLLQKHEETLISYTSVRYCLVCNEKIEKENEKNKCHICTNPLINYYYLDCEKQIEVIMNNNQLFDRAAIISEASAISGFCDGELYKHIQQSGVGHHIQTNELFTFLLSTDGLSLFKNSQLTAWPIFLVCNEIPKEKRFSIDNVILAGFSVGYTKPNFNEFLAPIIKSLLKFEYGIPVLNKSNYKSKTIHFYLSHAVFDKPAKAAVLNIVASNGRGGCHVCLQEGETYKTAKGGTVHIYPYIKTDPTGPVRRDNDYDLSVLKASSSWVPVNGIKGLCVLSHLRFFRPLQCTSIDYMHSLLEGVCKCLLKYWFASSIQCSYSLKKYMKAVDERLLSIRPPTFTAACPRSIYTWAT